MYVSGATEVEVQTTTEAYQQLLKGTFILKLVVFACFLCVCVFVIVNQLICKISCILVESWVYTLVDTFRDR